MNSFSNPSGGELHRILESTKSIAVVGISDNPGRPSNRVSTYMQAQGYRILPVNPMISSALGEPAVASLAELTEQVDMVCIFRRSEEVPHIVEAAIGMKGLKVIWMQDHVMHQEAARVAREAGLEVVMNDCLLRRHQQLIGTRQP